MKLLVTGLNVFDSGKTWLAIALYKEFIKRGIKPSIYKPVASFNLWFSHKTYVESIKRKILLSNDVLMYQEHLNVSDLGEINPISIGLAPLDPENYRVQGELEKYHRDIQDLFTQIVISRITNCEDKTIHYHFNENIKRTTSTIRNKIYELSKVLDSIPYNLDEFKSFLVSMVSEELLTRCAEKISRNSDVMIVESFNDSLAPYGRALLDSDYIIVVAPTVVYVYKNEEYFLKVIEDGLNQIGIDALRTYYSVQKAKPLMRLETDLSSSPENLVLFAEKVISYISEQIR